MNLQTEQLSDSTSASHRFRVRCAGAAFLSLLLGLATRRPGLFPGEALANTAGGALYVLFGVLLLCTLFPRRAGGTRRRRTITVGAVTLATCAIEFSQLWSPGFLEAVRATLPGRLVLGTTYSSADFLGYFVGAIFSAVVLGILAKTAAPRSRRPTLEAPRT